MKRIFTIPDDKALIAKEIVVVLIEAIPLGWSSLHGGIVAPTHILYSGEALASTKWIFGNSIDQMVRRANQEMAADICGIFLDHKHPAEIQFGDGMFGRCRVMPIAQSKRMAAHYVGLGYRGRLDFEYREPERIGDATDFGCDIWLPSDDPKALPVITIECNSEWPDNPEDGRTVAPLMELCERLLVEKTPVVA